MRGQTCPEHQNASIDHRVSEADSSSVPWKHSLQDYHSTSTTHYSDTDVSKDSVGDLSLKVFGFFGLLGLLEGVGCRIGSDDELRAEDHLEDLELPIFSGRGHKINCDYTR